MHHLPRSGASPQFLSHYKKPETPATLSKSPQSAPSTSRHSAVSGRKLKATEPYVGPLGGYPKPQQFVQSVSKSTTTPRIRLQIWNCSFNALVDSKARRSLISNTLFDKLRQQEENLQYSKEVAVDLFDIRKRPLICQGTVEVNVLVEEERPHSRLPPRLRVDPYGSTKPNRFFEIALIKETNHTIVLHRHTTLKHVSFKIRTHVASCSKQPSNLQPDVLEASLTDVEEDVKRSLRNLLLTNQHVLAFTTSDLGNTGLVKHVIDTQGLGPNHQRPINIGHHHIKRKYRKR
ncbi:hypothetical protein OUZ56_024229 [Daphnia magna]|uniref:Uncharacterized protein n=1 Tax=Daphnia magna TaxID=35525 RepID=A0ABR0B116_9CRUS|nr:hypothetical protein OUZ56_024229 [Daphnia magna]